MILRSLTCSCVALVCTLALGGCNKSSPTQVPDQEAVGPVEGDPAEEVIANEPDDADAMQEAESPDGASSAEAPTAEPEPESLDAE